MTKQVGEEPERKKNSFHIILLTSALMIPGIAWVVLGWASCFLPLVVFIYIQKYGWRYTNSHLIIAMLAASSGAYFFQSLELTFFGASLVPAGYVIAYSARNKFQPWFSGLMGTLTLAVCLYLFFRVLMIDSSMGILQALSESLNMGINGALKQYRESSSLSAENFLILEQTLQQMKTVAPLVMPAILGSIVMLISWMTVALGNVILPRVGASAPWKDYRFWQLPDKLIWLLIASGIFTVLPGEKTQLIGLNCLILTALPYAFQGLAIATFWLNKWQVPRFVRTIIYVMVFLQSFGTVILMLIGIADVWFDLRRIKIEQTDNESDIE